METNIGRGVFGGIGWRGICMEGRDLTDDFDDIVWITSLRKEINHTTIQSNTLKIQNIKQRFFSNPHTKSSI